MIMDIAFKADERMFVGLQMEFNILADKEYPEILELSHYELWKKTEKKYNPQDWKDFMLDSRVDQWYTEELLLIAKKRTYTLLRKAGDNKSVGEAQALAQAMNFINKYENKTSQETKIVYCQTPLSVQEEAAPNVKILQAIPDEIARAIVGEIRSK